MNPGPFGARYRADRFLPSLATQIVQGRHGQESLQGEGGREVSGGLVIARGDASEDSARRIKNDDIEVISNG